MAWYWIVLIVAAALFGLLFLAYMTNADMKLIEKLYDALIKYHDSKTVEEKIWYESKALSQNSREAAPSMISVPRGKDDLSLYRGIPSPLALAPWGFGQLLPAVSFSSCEFCNEQRNVLSVSLHPFIFRKRHWSTRYTQFAMILAGVLLGQIPCLYAPFGANTAKVHRNLRWTFL